MAENPKLLVVDDEPAVAEFIRVVASEAGFAASATGDNPDFSGVATMPDLLVLDLQMPGRDGVETIRDLGRTQVGAAILLVSGLGSRMLASAAELAEAQGLRVMGTLSKPFSYKELLGTLRHAREELGVAVPVWTPRAVPEPVEALSAAEIREGMETCRIEAHYQPILGLTGTQNLAGRRLGGDEIVGFEALARWNHPVRGNIPPLVFVRAAEQLGLGGELNWYILAQVLADLRGGKLPAGIPVSVNFNANDLVDVGLPDRLAAAIQGSGLATGAISIELTESSVIHDLASVLDTMMRLRMKGVGLWLDDFGTGYSSMEQLRRLPLTGIKIDRSFVPSRPQKDDSGLLRSVVDIAHRLGLPTVCEGVETEEQMMLIRDAGCQGVQGFHVARPMPAANVAPWVASFGA